MESELIQTFFTLRTISPFDRASENTLLATARLCRRHQYPPNQLIAGSELELQYAYIFLSGDFSGMAPGKLPCLWGLPELLRHAAPELPLVSGPSGIDCWRIPKSQILVLLQEAPELIIGALRNGTPTPGIQSTGK
jgi:hypothetical protein